jgi:hypothetical protein
MSSPNYTRLHKKYKKKYLEAKYMNKANLVGGNKQRFDGPILFPELESDYQDNIQNGGSNYSLIQLFKQDRLNKINIYGGTKTYDMLELSDQESNYDNTQNGGYSDFLALFRN